MGGIDGLGAGDPVTAEQMRALFGCGHASAGRAAARSSWKAPTSLGSDFRESRGWVRRSRSSTARSARSGSRWRSGSLHPSRRSDSRATLAVAAADRARVRTAGGTGVLLARAWPRADRCPRDRRPRSRKSSRPRTQTVAGYRPDVLAGQVGVDLVGGRRTRRSRRQIEGRTRPP